MRLAALTKVWIVSHDGVSNMVFSRFLDAIAGGLKLDEAEVFTEESEAKEANRARLRRRHADQFDKEDILRADKMVLLDSEGGVIHEIPFCPTD